MKFLRKIINLRLIIYSSISFLLLTNLWVILYKYAQPPLNILVYRTQLPHKLQPKRFWVNFNEIPDNFKKAAISSEDSSFINHNGFNFKAIINAYNYNRTHKIKIGASTITQQTARNTFLWLGKSWFRKGLEAYFTLLMEIYWSKKRIIEVYLNSVQTGSQTFGIYSAYRTEFKSELKNTSDHEASLIIALLPNPRVLSSKKYIFGRRLRAYFIMKNLRKVNIEGL